MFHTGTFLKILFKLSWHTEIKTLLEISRMLGWNYDLKEDIDTCQFLYPGEIDEDETFSLLLFEIRDKDTTNSEKSKSMNNF
jgi:hypothetical protein